MYTGKKYWQILTTKPPNLCQIFWVYYIHAAIPKPNIVRNEVEQFASEAVDILLEWTVQGEIRGLMYNVSISPQANIQYTGMRNTTLSLSYNIPYNVTIAALCGENSSPPLYITVS